MSPTPGGLNMVNVKEFLRRHTTPNQLPFSIHSLTVDEVEYVSRQHELPFNLSKDMKTFDIVVKTCKCYLAWNLNFFISCCFCICFVVSVTKKLHQTSLRVLNNVDLDALLMQTAMSYKLMSDECYVAGMSVEVSGSDTANKTSQRMWKFYITRFVNWLSNQLLIYNKAQFGHVLSSFLIVVCPPTVQFIFDPDQKPFQINSVFGMKQW